MPYTVSLFGTEQHDTITGGAERDVVVGLAGDDAISGKRGADKIIGDYIGDNLLDAATDSTSFAQYGETGAWTVTEENTGHVSMSQTVDTVADTPYEIRFDVASNYGANVLSGTVEVLWNDVVVHTFDTSSALFDSHAISVLGDGGSGKLTFRAIESEAESSGPEIFTDAPVFYYETVKDIGGQDVTVRAIAEGQSHIYQVMNGKLHVFDPVEETYTAAGAEATVVINAIGFNQDDNLLYGIAVGTGVDALGNAVTNADLMMIDANGDAYRIGATPYRSWTADFDTGGNLWAFHSTMDRITRIDVDALDANGNPESVTYKFPKSMVTDQLWDVAFDAATQSFYGLTRPSRAGNDSKLYQIDISEVEAGGDPAFSTTAVTSTVINGEVRDGVPTMTFGAFMVDGDGNLYAGGNSGDHDMTGATRSAGGIYRVDRDGLTGEAQLALVADAPQSYSNDGAVDPRAMDPFTPKDTGAAVLIRSPEIIETPDASETYDDTLSGGGGGDELIGGFGDDSLIGGSGGDVLSGGVGGDLLFGGGTGGGGKSIYDPVTGQRFDINGSPLSADDDTLSGGDGDDFVNGGAGHDLVGGDAGRDTVIGGSGFDTVRGGDGDDRLWGGGERDTLDGGDGADTMTGGTGDDLILGGNGNDRGWGASGADTLDGGAGNDLLRGRNENDVLIGGTGIDTLEGGSHDDTLDGGQGGDSLDGGSGNDVVDGGDGNDRIGGGSGNDSLMGGNGKDYINAYNGNDTIDGGAGNDRIYLGAGDDVATGGAGADRFIFRSEDYSSSLDRITDLDGSEGDLLDLRALDLLAPGQTEGEWLVANSTMTPNEWLDIKLGSATLRVIDWQGEGSAFFDSVTAALDMS